jgi:Fe-S-cluster containining protein
MSQECLDCGACCASFRVSFYWGETDMHPDGIVPDVLTLPVSHYHTCMRGTEKKPPRCVALVGEVGRAVSCSIYTQRSSTCREFEAGTEACNKARTLHGLPIIAQHKLF